jgi:NADPH:quinone reductase-like Zn-dependent oxidoreductase
MCVNEEEAVRAPSHLDAAEAATLPTTAVTAWHSLHHLGSLKPGDTVLIQGTGGVSTAAVQFARAAGARVIVLTRRENHRAKLMDLGASAVVVGEDNTDWPQRVVSLTGGVGVDVALDVAGGASLNQCIASTRIGGHVHLIGFSSGASAKIDIFDAIRHGTTIHVATAGNRRSFEELARAMEFHGIRPAISRRFNLRAFREALDELARGGHFGKIVLEF